MKLFTLPNLFTLGNLLCGCLAIIYAREGRLDWCAYLTGIAAILDFFDGFVARALKSNSQIGKELDSLADCVTFGVVPGMIIFSILEHLSYESGNESRVLSFSALLIPLFSVLRLAKFNVDTRQSDSFIGVPTPANALLICSLAILIGNNSQIAQIPEIGFISILPSSLSFLHTALFWISLTLTMSFLLVSELPLFALKFKSFDWSGNEIRWGFLFCSFISILLFGFLGIALSIVLYIVISLVTWLALSSR